MNRRDFLKVAGGGGVVALGGGYVFPGQFNFSDTIDVKLYQTSRTTNWLTEELGVNKYNLYEFAKQGILEAFNDAFPSVTINIEYGRMDVDPSITDPAGLKPGTEERSAELWDWTVSNREDEAKHSNILIGRYLPKEEVKGVAASSPFPSCCSPLSEVGIVWMGIYDEQRFKNVLTHEVGHTLGLTHRHGCVFRPESGEIRKSLMLTDDISINIYGDFIPDDSYPRALKLNDQIDLQTLKI